MKSSSSPPREREIFLAALEFSEPARRDEFLTSACGSDLALRQRVEDLLGEQEHLGTFLDSPALAEAAQKAGRGPESDTVVLNLMPDRIGRYKLLQIIGEGGCGMVYMAEQEQPVRRRVALKLIKAGMDTRSVIARFEAERQALALMDHANIAKVLDAGATETGRPYFVMDLVRGIRITEFCDENNLTTRERLELFVKVCQAIQHAHQKGIIHRDIKPSNILVTLHDGVPVPKVIDFGIAKAVEQRLTDKTVFTAFEQFIGTPAYMSPEQAEMSGLDIDTRSDIYSLGVLLYELLTSKTPFDGKELVESGLDAMRRTIREQEPLRPSTRLQTLEMSDATDLVKHRKEALPSLLRLIRGDLDWIVMKAVAKDRTHRYETANALAMDVQRYLNGDTVTARPPSRRYRLQKFVYRHKMLVVSGATVGCVLLLGVVVSSWQAFRATQAEHEQMYLRRVAETAQQSEAKQRQRAESERMAALRRAYDSDMNLVPQALQANNYGRVIDLLNRHRRTSNPELRTSKAVPEPEFRQWEWRYFWNQARSDAAFAFPRQSNTISTVSISPDSRRLASSDRSGTVKLWDFLRRTEVATLREGRGGDRFRGTSLAFSPDGERLALAFNDSPRRSQVEMIASATGQVLSRARMDAGVRALAFSADGARLLLWGEDEALRTWNFISSELVSKKETIQTGRSLSGFGRGFARSVFSPDSRLLASAEGGAVRLLDAETGAEKAKITAFDQGVGALAISPDGALVAVTPLFTEVDTAIKLFSTSTGDEVGKLTNHVSWVPGVTFSPDGQRLVSAGADQTVRIWNVAERRELTSLRGHFSEVNCIAISADGKTLVSGCKDGTLFGWDAQKVDRIRRFETLPAQVESVQFLPDSQAMLSVNRDRSVVLWDAATLQEREELGMFDRNVERIAISPDGVRLYAGGRDGHIKVVDWPTRTVVTNVAGGQNQRGPVIPVAVMDGGRTLVTVGPGYVVRLWDTVSWQAREIPLNRSGPPFFAPASALSRDERFLAIAGHERTIDILNLSTGKADASLNLENWSPSGMAFSREGILLAVASSEGAINLWDLASRSVVDVLRGHLLGVHDVAFSPDGERLASSSAKADEAVKLWDVTSRHEVATLAGDGSLFRHVKFSPDGTLLVAINSQGQAHVWRAPSLQEIERLEAASR